MSVPEPTPSPPPPSDPTSPISGAWLGWLGSAIGAPYLAVMIGTKADTQLVFFGFALICPLGILVSSTMIAASETRPIPRSLGIFFALVLGGVVLAAASFFVGCMSVGPLLR